MNENVNARDSVGASVIRGAHIGELHAAPYFLWDVRCLRRGREIWRETFRNTVMTAGKNDLLDKYFAGSAYTAAWYGGLIALASYSAISAADTMASHAGWIEDVNYSNSTRVAATWSAAAAGAKALAAALAFNINGTTTIKGLFMTTGSGKSGTSGILYSAGLFTGGDKAVASGDTLNVSGTWTIT